MVIWKKEEPCAQWTLLFLGGLYHKGFMQRNHSCCKNVTLVSESRIWLIVTSSSQKYLGYRLKTFKMGNNMLTVWWDAEVGLKGKYFYTLAFVNCHPLYWGSEERIAKIIK